MKSVTKSENGIYDIVKIKITLDNFKETKNESKLELFGQFIGPHGNYDWVINLETDEIGFGDDARDWINSGVDPENIISYDEIYYINSVGNDEYEILFIRKE